MSSRTWLWLDLCVKAVLIVLLLFGAFSGLERFEGKAFTGRALAYPICTVIVPLGWWLVARRRERNPTTRTRWTRRTRTRSATSRSA